MLVATERQGRHPRPDTGSLHGRVSGSLVLWAARACHALDVSLCPVSTRLVR